MRMLLIAMLSLALPALADTQTITVTGENCSISLGDTQPPQTLCVPTPDVEVLSEMSWDYQQSYRLVNAESAGGTSIPFTATSSTDYSGYFRVISESTTRDRQRRVWFSTCPGGNPIPKPGCEQVFTGSTYLKWSQRNIDGRCYLEPGKDHYLNVQGVGCASGENCAVYLNSRTNEKRRLRFLPRPILKQSAMSSGSSDTLRQRGRR